MRMSLHPLCGQLLVRPDHPHATVKACAKVAAVIGITYEHNRLFQEPPANENMILHATGLTKLLSASVGGVPMCHYTGASSTGARRMRRALNAFSAQPAGGEQIDI